MGYDETDDPSAYLDATWYIDSDHRRVREFADRARADAHTDTAIATKLFIAVRDGIRYNPYPHRWDDPERFRASGALTLPDTWCVPKAVILVALARASEIPARLGFADVKNHLSPEKVLKLMGTDVFFWHGYAELFIENRWVKGSPAFDKDLCARYGVPPLDFDGVNDALLHAFVGDGQTFMEYLHERGSYSDLPYEQIVGDLRREYPYLASVLSCGAPGMGDASTTTVPSKA